jgi:hypothetical protein
VPDPLAALPDAATRAATDHVGACSRWLFETEEMEVDAWPPSPAVGAFDGCDTCAVREALAAAWPVWLAGVLDQLRADGHPDAADALAAAAARHPIVTLPAVRTPAEHSPDPEEPAAP